jgi:hypothetical protein
MSSPKQISSKIEGIAEKYKTLLKYMMLGPSSLTKGELKLLIRERLLSPKFFKLTLGDAYMKTHSHLLTGTSRKSIRELTVKHLKESAGQLIDGFMDKVKYEVGNIINNNLLLYHEKLKNVVPETLAAETLKGTSVKAITRVLQEKMGNYATDWDRIVTTEVSRAHNAASIDSCIENNKDKDFKEIYVYYSGGSLANSCKHCISLLYLSDQITPKVFKLSEILANGTNVGRKAADWRAVSSTIHPNCTHLILELPVGFGFKAGKLVFISKDHDEYASQNS